MTYSQVVASLRTCSIDANVPEFSRESSLRFVESLNEWGIVGRGLQVSHLILASSGGFLMALVFWLLPTAREQGALVVSLPISVAALIVLIETVGSIRRKRIGWILRHSESGHLELFANRDVPDDRVAAVVEITYEQSMRPDQARANLSINPDFARTALALLKGSEADDYSLYVICFVQIGNGFPKTAQELGTRLKKPVFRVSTC